MINPDQISRRHSFTLIEMLVVMSIIIVLAGALMAVASTVNRGNKIRKTKTQIRALELALEAYKDDYGYYPQSGSSEVSMNATFMSSLTNPQNGRAYINEDGLSLSISAPANDGFGKTFYYQSPGEMNPMKFDLWSAGPDGLYGDSATTDPDDSQTESAKDSDDLANWMRLD